MVKSLDKQLLEKMASGKPADRKLIAGEEFVYFAVYYFRQFFTHGIPEFHWEMYNDLMQLSQNKFKYLLWVMFRDSAKTSLSKIFVIWCICFKKKHYINWDSYDIGNAESALFDIALALQTNKLLIRDFGHLYREKVNWEEKKTMKRVKEFITANDIKVEAFSTGQPVRGRLRENYRPDLFIVDDFENALTVLSLPTMEKIRKHIFDEMMGGLAVNSSVIFLGNLITEAGVVYSLIEASEKNPDMRYRRVDVEMEGQLMWPQKFVWTDKKANELNKDRKPEEFVVSLEAKKRALGRAYATEMMNSPEAAGDLFFDRNIIDQLIEKAKKLKPIKVVAGRHWWAKFDPSHRYDIGADTSKGVGLDSNASVGIDFTPNPNIQILSYASNEIPPDSFAHELKAEGEALGECLIAPEVNAQSGGTCVNELKNTNYPNIYIQRTDNSKAKVVSKQRKDLGWATTSANKHQMMFALKRRIEEGHLAIRDVRILKEARKYTQADLREVSNDGTTRHFDLLIACAIADQMMNFAEVSKNTEPDYVQPHYEGSSVYESTNNQVEKDWDMSGQQETPNEGMFDKSEETNRWGRVF